MFLGVGDASTFEEHDQVVVALGGSEDFVPAVAVHGDSPAARAGGPVHDDRRVGHASLPPAGSCSESAGAVRSITSPVEAGRVAGARVVYRAAAGAELPQLGLEGDAGGDLALRPAGDVGSRPSSGPPTSST